MKIAKVVRSNRNKSFKGSVIFYFLGYLLFLSNSLVASAQEDFFTGVLNGDLSKVKIAITENADINAGIEKKIEKIKHKSGEYFEGSTALHIASGEGNIELVTFLIENGIEINKKNSVGITAFMTALYHKEEDIAKFLLGKGAKLFDKSDHSLDNNEKYYTTLMAASEGGCLQIVKLLIKNKVNVNEKTFYNYTALWLASKKGHLEIVKILLDNKADIHIKNSYGETAFMISLSYGHEDIAKLLLKNGANINDKNDIGWTPLMAASQGGCFKMVKLLIKRNADINAIGYNGYTALWYALGSRHFKIAKLLIKKKADMDAQFNPDCEYSNCDELGFTPLQYYSKFGDLEIVKFLIENNADINKKNPEGNTAFLIALINREDDVARFLLQKGAEIKDKNYSDYTPLMAASWAGNYKIVKALIKRNVDLNEISDDGYGYSALWSALSNNQLKIAKYLIRHGADVNLIYINRYTVLHLATRNKQREIVKLLLSKNADASIKNNEGKTPIDIAIELGDKELVDLFSNFTKN